MSEFIYYIVIGWNMASQTKTMPVESTSNNETALSVEETRVYDDVDITDAKLDIVEYIAKNPGATNRDVANELGCSISYPSRVRDQHGDIILARAEELGSDVSELEESIKRRQQKRAESWNELTDKQQAVLRRLAEENDPENPDASLRAMIEDLSFDTNPAYLSDVKRKYSEFAVRLKHARKIAKREENPEALVDTVSLDDCTSNSADDSESADNEIPGRSTSSTAEVTDSVDVEELEELLVFARTHRELAESELEMLEDNEMATGKLIVAEQFEEQLKKIL